jgi:hypothetical protein
MRRTQNCAQESDEMHINMHEKRRANQARE